jgi:hypothetical protein
MTGPAGWRVAVADEGRWDDVRTVLGSRADGARCWCQRYRMAPGESWARVGAEALESRLHAQVADTDGPATAVGIVGYLDDEPVGWCALAPRRDHDRLLLRTRVPWEGRDEDRQDPGVWAVTCFVTRVGHGRQGVATALAAAAVDVARRAGARAVEAYPMTTTAAMPVELHPGTVAMFLAAGMREVRRSGRRAVVRLDL